MNKVSNLTQFKLETWFMKNIRIEMKKKKSSIYNGGVGTVMPLVNKIFQN